MSDKRRAILRTLADNIDGRTPTGVGIANGKPYGRASGWACSGHGGLRQLKIDGLVERNARGWYRITDAGRAELRRLEGET